MTSHNPLLCAVRERADVQFVANESSDDSNARRFGIIGLGCLAGD